MNPVSLLPHLVNSVTQVAYKSYHTGCIQTLSRRLHINHITQAAYKRCHAGCI